MLSVFELMSYLRIWDGWKIRIPIDTAGVYSEVQRYAKAQALNLDIEVGYATKNKVGLTILAESVSGMQSLEAINTTARDGELAVLMPITAMRGSDILITMSAGVRRPDVYVLPSKVGRRTSAWFVYSRERTGEWLTL